MKSALDKLSKPAAALVCTSVDDVRSSLIHYSKETLPILREAESYLKNNPANNTSKLLMISRKIRRLEKDQRREKQPAEEWRYTSASFCAGGPSEY